MDTSPAPLYVVTPSTGAIETSNEERRRRWFELFLVLSLSVGLSLLNSIYFLQNAPTVAMRLTSLRNFYGIVQESLSLLLLTYVLSRRKISLRDLGLQWSRRDIAPSLAVTILSYLAYVAGAWTLQFLHYELYRSIWRGTSAKQFFSGPTLMAVPFMLLNPFFEELIVRAYVMTEIKGLTGSTALAIGSSVVLQASYHLYYGWYGALSVAFLFLVFAIYYARCKRVGPIIFAHAAFDLYALVRMM
jgi:membrane protease YdiL (CAAX protease family)